MMLADRISAFAALGNYLKQLSAEELDRFSRMAQSRNGWFTPANVRVSLQYWSNQLQQDNLEQWLSHYTVPAEQHEQKLIGLVLPGTTPLEGFHDLLSVLMSGHLLQVKPHATDLLPHLLVQELIRIAPGFSKQLQFSEQLKGMDAYIATGDEGAVRTYRTYFKSKPHLIRQTRRSCALLSGRESEDELKALGRDMLQFWGMGSRSVGKLFVPKGYQFPLLFNSLEVWADVQNHHKWINNYDYHKSILLVNGEPHLDTGFLLFREAALLHAPPSVMYYQYYQNREELESLLAQHSGQLEFVVGPADLPANTAFGQAHRPLLWQYPNGVDTLHFLLNL